MSAAVQQEYTDTGNTMEHNSTDDWMLQHIVADTSTNLLVHRHCFVDKSTSW